jgi:hypothetical protein
LNNTLFLYDSALRDLYQKLHPLLAPPPAAAQTAKRIYALNFDTLARNAATPATLSRSDTGRAHSVAGGRHFLVPHRSGKSVCCESGLVRRKRTQTIMKKLICILASAALFGACEQKTTTVNPTTEKKTENNTTVVKPADSTKKTESTTTTTSSSPNP